MYFNTSHVTVYQVKAINSMTEEEHFNTSHVTVYHAESWFRKWWKCDFNTSHVTVYRGPENRWCGCVCISIHPMLRFIYCSNLRKGLSVLISIHPMLRFIFRGQRVVTFKDIFQYIPCYGLSWTFGRETKETEISIHPMLRFIMNPILIRWTWRYFNTSHVTVYRKCQRCKADCYGISIHPMLRFI